MEIIIETRTDKDDYLAGEEVGISVSVANKGLTPVELVFTSTQRYDFIALKDGEEVWRWSKGKVFAMVLGHLRLEPGEVRGYAETWNPGDAEPGEYTVTGMVTSQPPLRATCRFKVGS